MRISSTLMALPLLLAACGTPLQQCVRAAMREVGTLDRLVAETEANLARGYAYEEKEILRREWRRCDGYSTAPGKPAPMCFEPVFDTVKRPVAIDPLVETRKLDALMSRRTVLAAQARAQTGACRVKFPES